MCNLITRSLMLILLLMYTFDFVFTEAAIPLPSASSESLGPGPDHAFAKRDTTTCEGIVIGTQTTSSWQSCR